METRLNNEENGTFQWFLNEQQNGITRIRVYENAELEQPIHIYVPITIRQRALIRKHIFYARIFLLLINLL